MRHEYDVLVALPGYGRGVGPFIRDLFCSGSGSFARVIPCSFASSASVPDACYDRDGTFRLKCFLNDGGS